MNPASPLLVLITGLPGTGKSTIARAYAEKYGALHLNSDLVRREMHLMGHYSPADKEAVYNALLQRTAAALAEGREVLVDSTFYKAAVRQPFEQLAARYGAHLKWVAVKADEAVIRQRVTQPRPDSEADFEVYKKIKMEFEPLCENHLVLWSDKLTIDALTVALRDYLYPNS